MTSKWSLLPPLLHITTVFGLKNIDRLYNIFTHVSPFLIFFLSSDKWSPALQIRTVLLSIQALLSAPNPDDPLANDVAEKWKSSEAEAIETGEVWSSRWFVTPNIQILSGGPFTSISVVCRR